MSRALPSTFVRDRLTWLTYGLLAYYAYLQAALGPVMPFLRDELALSYTLGGLHPTAFAAGMIVSGALGDRWANRLGRRRLLVGGAVGMGAGVLLFAAGLHLAVTLPATFLMGLAGTLLLVMIQAILADHHGAQRATALTEANVAASVSASLAPLAVGSLAAWGMGWRGGLLLPLLLLLFLAPTLWRTPVLPAPVEESSDGRAAPLPGRFWAFWLVLLLGVAAEWCVVLWSADYLETVVGFERSQAALWMTTFFVAAVVGRVIGSFLTRYIQSETLLLAAFVVASGGFLLFWQAPVAGVQLLGLFISGLGIANLFPLTLSVAVGVARTQSNAASARAALGAGIAILLAPLTLGGIADQWGLQRAFVVIIVLLAVAFAVTIIASRSGARWQAAAS